MAWSCKFPGCKGKQPGGAKGLCAGHYWQQKVGRPLTAIERRGETQTEWIERHSSHESDECLIWPFAMSANSRPAFVGGKKTARSAVRYMCELANGQPPTPRHQAAHSCGKGHLGCINPRHLSWKTPKENNDDKVVHGTQQIGSKHGMAKLDEDRVAAIRRMAPSRSEMPSIALMHGVTVHAIRDVVSRRTWRHV